MFERGDAGRDSGAQGASGEASGRRHAGHAAAARARVVAVVRDDIVAPLAKLGIAVLVEEVEAARALEPAHPHYRVTLSSRKVDVYAFG